MSDQEPKQEFKPFVSADADLAELTFKAVFLGVIMAVVLGAANAYVGMQAGLTVAATFPAAVVAMAALRIFKGSILEENIARTTASVGEALVAGAIFTIPAFVISGVWDRLRFWESTAIMVIGGVLGVLFVIVLRRTLVEEADLPFPESVATGELVKAGQGGQTGAVYVFAAMGIAGVWELFKNSLGLQLVSSYTRGFISLGSSTIEVVGRRIRYAGGLVLESPAASPMLVGVGFIVGPGVASILFSGAVMGHLLLVPIALFLNPALTARVGETLTDPALVEQFGGAITWSNLASTVWSTQVRPLAVGAMIVAAFYTLFNLRTSLIQGVGKALSDLKASKLGEAEVSRLQIDLDFRVIGAAIAVLCLPLFGLYFYFSRSLLGAVLLTVVMVILGFLFAAVAGYLVGLIGSSNNPISGLTLSTLLIASVLMVGIGVTGDAGVMAVLGVAGVVCCAAGIAGDMMQDLKVGHILGGTPWRMEIGEIAGVVVASLVLIWPMILMDSAYGIGSETLPAPQAGLMALISKGIVGGEMAWPLVLAGMFLSVGLILIKAPAPMVIAVGMYLPFYSTSAIFVGGVFRWALDRMMIRRNLNAAGQTAAANAGILLSSGFIAGESLMAVALALLYMAQQQFPWADLPQLWDNPWVAMLAFPALFILLTRIPLGAAAKGGAPGVKVE